MNFIKHFYWKFAGALMILYSLIAGLLIDVPELPIIEQTIRNVFFHVTMWFTMIAVFLYAFIQSIRFLSNFNMDFDRKAVEAVYIGLVFGILGLITGMIWAKFTWGSFWVNDPKLNGAAVSLLVYAAYTILRKSVENEKLRAKLAAVYCIFAFILLVVFVGILPRVADGSLHPGATTDSPFAVAKMQSNMYHVFWSAVIGWIIFAFWLIDVKIRVNKILNINGK